MTERVPLYFPPDAGPWERVSPASVGWDATDLDAALDVAGERASTGVVVLHHGRIMAERYWELDQPSDGYGNMLQGTTAGGQAIEDVASVQKGIVVALTGIARHRGLLTLDDPVSRHLGLGWSRASEQEEAAITIRHLLSMTSGLKSDLTFETRPGSKWYYNTPAYHHVLRILAEVAGEDRRDLTRAWLTSRIGIEDSSWAVRPWSSTAIGVGFASTARDLARFGLLILAGGAWNDQIVLEDQTYLKLSLQPSQQLNPAYGLMWWLNGQPFWRLPTVSPDRVEETLIRSAPSDLVALQGALDRKVYVIPSLGLVVTRLGDNGSSAGSRFNDVFWNALSQAAPE